MIKIGINGFGRIGRNTFRILFDKHPEVQIVAINDLTDAKTLAHLLQYDSNYGTYGKDVSFSESSSELIVAGKKVKIFKEMEPEKIPWGTLGIDVVIESTGQFTDYAGASKHIIAGAKKVIISAPSDDPEKIPSFNLGVNEAAFDGKADVVDMGSCTTNCLSTVAKVLHDNFTIKKGFMSTIHSYTNDQRTLDLMHKDLRRARTAAMNIIPTSTGAAKAIGLVMPELQGKLHGLSLRVPTSTVSIVDLVVDLAKPASTQAVNDALRTAADGSLKGILGFCDEPLVSSDFRGNAASSIVDGPSTVVMEGKMAKVLSWYDNEWGYSCRVGDLAAFMAEREL